MSSKPPTRGRSLADDDRAIEGLPIRLVIALIVGVVSLGIMLQILGGIDTFETGSEVDVEFEQAAVDPGDDEVSVFVVDDDANEVTGAVVIAEPGANARMDGAITQETGDCQDCEDNEVELDFDDAGLELPPDATTGEIEFSVQPPADSNWEDEETNNRLLVVEGGTS